MISMNDLLILMVQKKASDLHLTVGAPPALRVDGVLIQTNLEKMTPDMCQRLIYSLLSDVQKQRFESENELDISFGIKGLGRVRMNVFRQRGSVGAALRSVPSRFMSFEELGLPPVINDVVNLPRGLVLVTGPTGSGKSTTLASLIDYINENRQCHIVTIEDPIEYIHFHKQSLVNQRELGTDTQSFTSALKYVLRQDPDVILVGEMRDAETIAAAMTIAETGHLVFSTLHTNDAAGTVNRILDSFPPERQEQARSQLSFTLQAILSQALLMHASGSGRVLAAELLLVTPAVRNLVREQKVEQIYLAMQTGSKSGMQTMNQCLLGLVQRGQITHATALEYSNDVDELRKALPKETSTGF
ncbi:MAG TPA: type IV pilus twitching motility protein PilT [Elusimicrobiota bacterium]|jgi:twitching motility protein PilT|nr:type IV pilus twitching motility protein PilT [Elusimicrobiota bacterium]HND64841.1 type IV pilus twitching motility protein PilT [Elusimicrobiota bacterium]HNF58604.1 type IV pilus twitching motility protein PilT [Elusimicrobiota bacterium]HNG44346.1 type IV pilus twitching motility protein PilT [Elusimicrobiota bacterium]HNI57122.1 type IV pilus twitching motility protein PilT [Elusimicrobiota bacterium]